MQEKPEPVLDETPNGHCIHTLVIMPDLGRTCTQCGLVTERIEHMSFIYHAPVGDSFTATSASSFLLPSL